MSINRHFAEETYGKDVVAAAKGSIGAKTLTEQSMTIAWALTSKDWDIIGWCDDNGAKEWVDRWGAIGLPSNVIFVVEENI